MPAKLKFAFVMSAARFFLVSLLLSLLTLGARAQVSFRIEVLFDEVGVDKAFQVQYTLENAGSIADMQLQPTTPFTVVGNYADASRISTQFINGKSTTTRVYTRTYTLRASQTGFFRLPPAVARTTDGKTYRSDPKMIEVVASNPHAGAAPPTDPFTDPYGGFDPLGPDPLGPDPFGPGSPFDRIADAFRQERRLPTIADLPKVSFLQIVPRKTTAYEGEPVIVEYLLVSGIPVSGNLNKMPAPDGFWVEEISGDKEERGTKVVGNKVFETLLIKRVALIPQRSGNLTIEPAEMQAVGTIDDGFGNGQQHTWEIRSAPVTLKILPLPKAGKPSSFHGAVGDFRIEASLDPPTMPRNGAAALRLVISGEGNLAQLDAPRLELPEGLQAEPAIAKNDLKTDGQHLTGSRTFTYPITASAEGNFTIPPVRFSFFQPQTGRYEEITTQPLLLSVTEAEMAEEGPRFSAKKDTALWIAGICVLVAGFAGVLIWRRRAQPQPAAKATPADASSANRSPLVAVPAATAVPPPTTVREAIAALDRLISGKTGQPMVQRSAADLEALGLDVPTAQQVFIFRKKAEAALYGGSPVAEADLVAEGRALLARLSSWHPLQNQ